MLSHTIFTHTTKQKTKENLNADYGMKKKKLCALGPVFQNGLIWIKVIQI